MAVILVVLCLVSSLSIPSNGVETGGDTSMRKQVENTTAPSTNQMPAATTPSVDQMPAATEAE